MFPRPHEGERPALTLLSARANYKAGGEAGGGSTAWVLVSSATAWRKPSWGAPSFLQFATHFLLVLPFLQPLFHSLRSPSLNSPRVLPHFLPFASFVPLCSGSGFAGSAPAHLPSVFILRFQLRNKTSENVAEQITADRARTSPPASRDVMATDKFVGDAPSLLSLAATLGLERREKFLVTEKLGRLRQLQASDSLKKVFDVSQHRCSVQPLL